MLESILLAAENKAATRFKSDTYLTTVGENQLLDSQYALAKANRELRNFSLRRRFLPQDLSSDFIWATLLKLLTDGNEGVPVSISDLGRSWDVSTDTATRQIAALIEAGLVARISNEADQWNPAIVLTSNARSVLEKILISHD